jgi:large subunit ribosomal protein L3
MAHGSKHHRLQGSLGAGTTPGRVFPGKKMPGRSGLERRTITGLEVINIDLIKNLILIKGSIPGKTGNLVNLSFPSFKDHKELV